MIHNCSCILSTLQKFFSSYQYYLVMTLGIEFSKLGTNLLDITLSVVCESYYYSPLWPLALCKCSTRYN